MNRRSLAGAALVALVALLLVVVWLRQGGTPSTSPTASHSARATAGHGPDRATSRPTKPSQKADPDGAVDPVSGLPWIGVDQLPGEARRTLEAIDRGGPFPHDKDGSTFGNFEGVLPRRERGYYREYTVPTPGENDRGARRIVTGDGGRERYWTADHYATFRRIR